MEMLATAGVDFVSFGFQSDTSSVGRCVVRGLDERELEDALDARVESFPSVVSSLEIGDVVHLLCFSHAEDGSQLLTGLSQDFGEVEPASKGDELLAPW